MCPSALIYHYTDAEGLKGILEGSIMWATDAEFVNDARELRFGRPEVVEALIAEGDRLLADATPGGPE